MSILNWNCQGLRNPRTVRDLYQMVEEKKPRILFLMETRLPQSRMQVIRNTLGFAGMLVVDPIGTGGGLALLWREEKKVEIQNYSLHHISAIVKLSELVIPWKLTGFYGHPDRSHREESCKLLTYLKQFQPHPWLCVGDFNEIVDQSEKVGVLREMHVK